MTRRTRSWRTVPVARGTDARGGWRDRVRRGERGAVTAETAMVLPLLVALTVGLVWFLALGSAQIRAVDAARETARALAREDPAGDALALGRQAAPAGARISTDSDAGRVRVTVTVQVRGPGGLFRHLPGTTVTATAVAASEASSEGG